MNDTSPVKRFESVNEYVEANGLKKGFVADRWGISRFQMTALIYPGRYPVSLTDEQVARIAADLNQSPEFVRSLYPAAA